MFIYEIMNYIFLKLECHFLTMILSHLSDFLQKKKKNVCTKFFLKTTYTMTRKKNALKKLRWRAKISNSYYYIDWNRFVICKTTEEENESDNLRYKNLNYFQTKEEAYTKLFAVKSVLND